MRGPLVVLSGVMLFSEHVSPLELFGYGIALIGFVWWVRREGRGSWGGGGYRIRREGLGSGA